MWYRAFIAFAKVLMTEHLVCAKVFAGTRNVLINKTDAAPDLTKAGLV